MTSPLLETPSVGIAPDQSPARVKLARRMSHVIRNNWRGSKQLPRPGRQSIMKCVAVRSHSLE